MPFRTHTSAAPLKQGVDWMVVSRTWHLPHSHECGPVEASALVLASMLIFSFRTHTSAAPLKHLERSRNPDAG